MTDVYYTHALYETVCIFTAFVQHVVNTWYFDKGVMTQVMIKIINEDATSTPI